MMTNIRERIVLHISYSVVAVIFIISLAVIISDSIDSSEYTETESVLKLAKLCGEREWIVYWVHVPGKSRNFKCLNRRLK